jgi:hypothetical protein
MMAILPKDCDQPLTSSWSSRDEEWDETQTQQNESGAAALGTDESERRETEVLKHERIV